MLEALFHQLALLCTVSIHHQLEVSETAEIVIIFFCLEKLTPTHKHTTNRATYCDYKVIN